MNLEVELGTGYRAAGCRGCGRVFTCVTAFDAHQRLTRQGLVCLNPVEIGLHRKATGRWGWKSTDYSFVRQLENSSTASSRGANATALVSQDSQAC